MKQNNIILVVVGSFMLIGSNLWACGPEFDSAYLIRASKNEFLAVPEGNFLFEVQRIGGTSPYQKPPEVTKQVQSVVDNDISDLKKALDSSNLSTNDKSAVENSYKIFRGEIADYIKSSLMDASQIWYGGVFRNATLLKLKIKTQLNKHTPKEFSLYMDGATAYYAHNYENALKYWKELLNLPVKERQYRSTWASFMIGKVELSLKRQKGSIIYFELTRRLVKEGFKDSLGLSDESYGWQALAEFEIMNYVESIHHYLKARDLNSLSWLVAKVFALKGGELKNIVKDDQARAVLLGWAVSRPNGFGESYDFTQRNKEDSDEYSELLKAIESLGDSKAINNADHIAWLYYNNGNLDKTKRWLNLARGKTNLSNYIEVKLMLRDGKVDQAINKLGALAKSFEASTDRDIFYDQDIVKEIHSELGVLKLSRKEYISSLDVLLKGRHWEDIAYVAEKVLTSSELEEYLKQNRNKKEMLLKQETYEYYYNRMLNDIKRNPEDKDWYHEDNPTNAITVFEALSHLLARKFVREGNWEKAIEYMPRTYTYSYSDETKDAEGIINYTQKFATIRLKEKVKELQGYLKKGDDKSFSAKDRAKSYYEAGLMVRKNGMELMGTELDPDGFYFNGGYEYFDSIIQRFSILTDSVKKSFLAWDKDSIKKIEKNREGILKKRDFYVGSEDEEERFVASLPEPFKRFHYRYKAANLMWKAAELLPDNDDLKAKALNAGGTYIKVLDPKGANKFYKALVNTCGSTELGKAAKKLKWFPKVKDN